MFSRPFMSLNVISRTEIFDVNLLLLLLFIFIKKNYSRITAEYLYSLTVKSTILKLLTKCITHHTCVTFVTLISSILITLISK
jgi:uncharacterized integral membrane protein